MSDTNEAVLFLAKQETRKMERSPVTIMRALVYKMNPFTPNSTEAVCKVIEITLADTVNPTKKAKCDHRFQWTGIRSTVLLCAACKKEWPL
jgi:hypothetical protein